MTVRLPTGCYGPVSCSQQCLDLLLNLNEPDAAIFVNFLSRMAGVLDLSVLSICLFNRVDLILQLFYFLGNVGGLHTRSIPSLWPFQIVKSFVL